MRFIDSLKLDMVLFPLFTAELLFNFKKIVLIPNSLAESICLQFSVINIIWLKLVLPILSTAF